MTKALIFGDVQATEGAERCFSDPALPLQRYRVDLFYKQLLAYYNELGCNAIWDLGDTTDDRVAIPLPTLRSISQGILPFVGAQHNIKLTGNHEQYTRNAEIDNNSIFSQVFNVVQGVKVFEIEGVAVIACSYPASTPSLIDQLKSLLLKHRHQPTIILGHLDVTGARVKSGVQLTGLPLEIVESASLALLGHIHLPQQLCEHTYYVGSPFQQDFGESGEAKRLGLLTIDGDSINLEWIAMSGFPEYRRASYAEFVRDFKPESEDRYSVRLVSPAEAEEFYKHPYSARVQVEYVYNALDTSLPGKMVTPTDWGLKAAANRWLTECDPASKGIAIASEELLEFGLQIAEGEMAS